MTRLSVLLLWLSAAHGFAPAAKISSSSMALNVLYQDDAMASNPNFDTKVLETSDLAGNWGFDPLHLAKTQAELFTYREAEIKHARLAILVVSAWMFNELQIIDKIGGTPFFEGRSFPQWVGALWGLAATVEMYEDSKAREHKPEYYPGNLGIDPLHLYPENEDGQKLVQLAEIVLGRVAMPAAAFILIQTIVAGFGFEQKELLSFLPSFPSAV